ncbi:MAG: hypothetical protein PHF37_05150, partial [Phycisphaerae bacterium]|nr:hypothetical protein [Phycisphaerae bacterium]
FEAIIAKFPDEKMYVAKAKKSLAEMNREKRERPQRQEQQQEQRQSESQSELPIMAPMGF